MPGQPARGRAAIHAYEGDFNVAFDQLLEVALRDKAEWREKARLQLVEWFDACPDPATVSRGRWYLGMYLNSSRGCQARVCFPFCAKIDICIE